MEPFETSESERIPTVHKRGKDTPFVGAVSPGSCRLCPSIITYTERCPLKGPCNRPSERIRWPRTDRLLHLFHSKLGSQRRPRTPMAAVRRTKSDGARISGQPLLSGDHRDGRLPRQLSGLCRKLVIATPDLSRPLGCLFLFYVLCTNIMYPLLRDVVLTEEVS